MICYPRKPRMNICTTKLLGSDILARCGFDERRSAEEDRARAFDDDGFVAHGGDVRATCRTASHHGRDLRDLLRRHSCLVVEDAAEMIHIRKDLVLQG